MRFDANPIKTGVSGLGYYVPDKIITNDQLQSIVNNFNPEQSKCSLDEWVQRRYGIKERRWSDEETCSYQATMAARNAIENAGLMPNDIDFIILNTSSGDYVQPTTATTVQKNLGIKPSSFALELNLPCGGPVYGISVAHSFLLSGKYQAGLVIGVDKMTAIVDVQDFKSSALFGEGAAAAVVTVNGPHRLVDFYLCSQGEEGEEEEFALAILAGHSKHPATHQTIERKMHYLRNNGKKVEQFAIESIIQSVNQLCADNSIKIEDVSYFIPHQAAKNIILSGYEQLNVPREKVLFSLEYYGNTSAASVLLTTAIHSHKFKKESKLILTAMGAGLNWGGLLLEW